MTERDRLEEMLKNAYEGQALYLETVEGELLASNLPEEELFRIGVSQRHVDDREFLRVNVDGVPCYARSSRIYGTNVYLVSTVPLEAVRRGMSVNGNMGVWFLGVSLVVLMVMGTMVKSVTGRLKQLKEQMLQIREGNICKMEEGHSRDEIGQLIGNYNVMVDRVDVLLKEQYTLGQEKVEAELMALQSQINPHFLYNTLDMINWMSQKKESENIRSVVQAMSRFYRLTLSKGKDAAVGFSHGGIYPGGGIRPQHGMPGRGAL